MRLSKSMFLPLVAALLLTSSLTVFAAGMDDRDEHPRAKHVLLISVDGLHALDLSNYIAAHPNSTLAALSKHGKTYTNATSSLPSDSFPGLAALVTGGSPVTTGFWYDVSFNRKLSPPAATNPFGITAGPCPGQIGTGVQLDEAVDKDLTLLNGGGGIDPNFLERDPNNGCKPVFPHEYLRVNTIFEVVKAHGGRTAWTDKHLSYEWTNGPSGHGVDDFYGPEINSIPVALPQFPGCSPVPAPAPDPDDGWTKDLANIRCYDSLHVQAVLNQIDGFTHDRSKNVGVPAVFGTNFQSVSVGQKLKHNGYQDVLGTPTPGLQAQLDFVDQSLGKMVSELKKEGLFDSTLIIVGAKHGQSPIDVQKRVGIGGGEPATTIGAPEAFDISDDGSLIWLTDSSLTASVVASLSVPAVQNHLGIQEIFALNSLEDKFNSPLHDERTPDIILKTNTGVIFTGGSKIAEHGGLNEDDIHTGLLVSMPGLHPARINVPVFNQQVAPTILRALGLDPDELDAVRAEHVQVLPFLFGGDDDQN
ncbi:MAG TPA: alkaline phosphatase family protein [Candidatus Angelobacter sp.]|nr:alkaline phosphatase family protein [Candidatus Angelobacter sp.]